MEESGKRVKRVVDEVDNAIFTADLIVRKFAY